MQKTAVVLVVAKVPVDPCMADRQPAGFPQPQADLLRAPLLMQQPFDELPILPANTRPGLGSSWPLRPGLHTAGQYAPGPWQRAAAHTPDWPHCGVSPG